MFVNIFIIVITIFTIDTKYVLVCQTHWKINIYTYEILIIMKKNIGNNNSSMISYFSFTVVLK